MTDNQNFEEDHDFYEDEDLPVINRWKIIGGALTAVIVAGFGIGIWYAYDQGVKKGVQLAPPIIKADNTPVKEDPKDRGGMEIAHQDKKVFDVLNSDKGEEKIEKLMAAPEEATKEAAPVDITETVRESAPATSGTGAAETLMAKPLAEIRSADTNVAKTTEDIKKKTVQKAEEVAKKVVDTPKKPEPKKDVTVAAKPPVTVKKSAAKSGNYRVQLGAFRSNDAAEKAWVDLQKIHKELLGNIPHRVQSVEIKGKGMFHRLQAGAFAEKVGANVLCSSLKAEKQDCLIAKN